ncbi:dipeptidyl aminopeptidase/acylaminoacyl peptidase [Mucilaginibacter frigoritolerans]|uniref:Dipeptidyl aminopeptidase/acylaminoacyl peptidase n=1 Tax=Mucilaginibacter frigoritolerans TaxID=652788 RepID=A0A562U9H4_9SPHI|nr:S9 family peptidase [Mucilaginibacter frigoritolerans]TWJ02470.1 dipeptidyl aminopeptidase/acylaminoacyl peptidase [Mucilaginibacter frigoritolerans]
MNKFFITAIPLMLTLAVNAQQGSNLTAKDYEHAESFLSYNTDPLIDHANVRPNWLPGDSFWYRTLTAQGSEFILVDPAKKTRTAAFDQQKLASALSTATGNKYEADKLPFETFSFSVDDKSITFHAADKHWKYDLSTNQCNEYTGAADGGEEAAGGRRALRGNKGNEILSPDGTKAAFIKEYNLWVRDVKTGKQTQLTTDGIKDFGYATDNAGWKTSDSPILLWSPDSKKIATFQQDERGVSDMYLVTTNVGKPTLKAWKYPLPGDKIVTTIQRVIINVDEPKVIRLQIPADPHRATLSDDISSSGTFDDVNWNEDASKLAFVSTSRDHKQEKVRIADAATGAVREVFEENVATQYESGWGDINWKYLAKTNEIIWFSERDNYGHLYLYDAATGKIKNQITKGDWVVTRLLKVDEKNRMIYFIADGREAENPYFSQLCKIGFDGKHFAVLTPEAGNHMVTLSPSGNYFIDSYSKPDVAPVIVLRNTDGKLIANLEKTDVSRLVASGWKPVTPFSAKANDGKTDIYGIMFTPTHLDPNKKYPIIDYIYPGPQGGSVGSWSFSASRGDNQALAELGFIVVAIEGTSNPLRSKSFHDMSYGNMAENTLPDQISAIRQLASKYNYIDTTKVGIWGHSGGGFATADAMFRYPDFFKVGISESGNHDNRNYEDDWGERYDGLAANSNYEAQANENYAKNLKGKLMLAHGLMDNNVPPQNTLLVVQALEKANKDYDLVIFPNSPHGYGPFAPYMMRRRWDYFVKNLQGVEPPYEYLLKSKPDPRNLAK